MQKLISFYYTDLNNLCDMIPQIYVEHLFHYATTPNTISHFTTIEKRFIFSIEHLQFYDKFLSFL